MKPARKKVSLVNLAGEAEAALRDIFYDQPLAWLKGARERARNLPKTNYDLGCDFAEQGKWMDAIFRFRVALYLQPAYPLAWYNLGCCYFRHGNRAKAKAALLKELSLQPGHPDSIFMLAAIDPRALKPGDRPQHMPLAMVTGFFSSIAEGYDQVEAQNGYQAGKLVFEKVKSRLGASDLTVVDLGCGSGIAARPWRALAKEISGVEITPAMGMLATAATQSEKKLFDQLIEADIAQLPDRLPADAADLVLVVNVVQFIGELAGVLKGAARLLKPGGTLAITVEPHAAQTGFGLSDQTGRFGHSAAYVKQAAQASGLDFISEFTVELYPEIPAGLFIFSKGARA
ncbi:MAG: methyltransferase domain-containing protein [Pseudomonadota bacterium]